MTFDPLSHPARALAGSVVVKGSDCEGEHVTQWQRKIQQSAISQPFTVTPVAPSQTRVFFPLCLTWLSNADNATIQPASLLHAWQHRQVPKTLAVEASTKVEDAPLAY